MNDKINETEPVEDNWIWKNYLVEELMVDDEKFVTALSFYFDNGRVSIYHWAKDWIFSTWSNSGSMIMSKKFRNSLSELSGKKELEFKSMLNSSGIANKNSPTILAHIALKMNEHRKEIEPMDVTGNLKNEPIDFFKRVENPSWKNALKLMRTSLHIEDTVPYTIGLTTFISNKITVGEPVWMFMIGPSASGKTELTKYFITGDENYNAWCYQLSEMTPSSLISGHKEAEDLMPEIVGKTLLFSDFTVMLSGKPEDVMAIFKQLREMYDGKYMKAFGSGVGVKVHKTNFSILAGVTNKIDMYKNLFASLGERFFSVRFKPSSQKYSEKVTQMAYNNNKMPDDTLKAIQSEILTMYENFDVDNLPTIGEEWEQYIIQCALITANLRIPIERNIYDQGKPVIMKPVVEEATRIVKVYKKIAQTLCYVLEKPEFDREVLSYLYRITLDSPEALRVDVLRALSFMDKELKHISFKIDMADVVTERVLEDLRYSRLVGKKKVTEPQSNEEGTGLEPGEPKTMYSLRKDSPVLNYIKNVELALGGLPKDQIHHNGMGISGFDMLTSMTAFDLKSTEEEILNSLNQNIEKEQDIKDDSEREFVNVQEMVEAYNVSHEEEHLNPYQEVELFEMERYSVDKKEIEKRLEEMDKEREDNS